MIVVSNASPLIALAKIGQLQLLCSVYKEVYISAVVREEVGFIRSGVENRPGTEEISSARWIQTVNVSNLAEVEVLRERLDAGESEAIVLAIELKADLLLIDEARGRKVAQAKGVNTTGTVGTLVAAKRKGLIPELATLLDCLVDSGFRMSEELYQTALLLGDEG